MLLGTYLPEDAELEASLTGSWYTTRGAVYQVFTYATGQLKKRHLYAGTAHVFGTDLGGIFDLADSVPISLAFRQDPFMRVRV